MALKVIGFRKKLKTFVFFNLSFLHPKDFYDHCHRYIVVAVSLVFYAKNTHGDKPHNARKSESIFMENPF